MSKIIIYTDGASRNNPGPGGYGAILISGKHTKKLKQGYKLTTNNRMELMAVIAALQALKKNNQQIEIYSDSKYVVNAVQQNWLNIWMKTNFKGGKKNADLWKMYYALAIQHTIQFFWVKGHADNPLNNLCDALATSAIDDSNLISDIGYEQLIHNHKNIK